LPASALTENASGQTTAPRQSFPFRLVLPLGQLLLCAALILIACGPGSFAGSVPPVHGPISAPPARAGVANNLVVLLNLPGYVLQAPVAAYCKSHHSQLSRYSSAITCGGFGWSVFALPLWWIAGRAIEALLAIRRNVVAPHIHWIEAAISLLLLFFGTHRHCRILLQRL